MKTQLIVSAVALLLVVPQAYAKSRTYCSGYAGTTYNYCFYTKMPLVSQNDTSLAAWFPGGNPYASNLCVPTSTTMAHAAILADGIGYYVNSWTHLKFAGKTRPTQIKAFMDYLGTTVDGGTSNGAYNYSRRAADIQYATSNSVNGGDVQIGDYYVRSRVNFGEVDILTYGHYTESCTTTFFGTSTLCTYTRNGGHAITPNGYYLVGTEAAGTLYTRFYNPWFAQIEYRDILGLGNRNSGAFGWIDTRPHGSNSAYVYRSGSAVKVVDSLGGVNTN